MSDEQLQNQMDGINVKEQIEKTIGILDILVNTEGIHTEQQRADMYAAQLLLIEVFGPADIRHETK